MPQAAQSALDGFLQRVGRCARLTPDEERRLTRRYARTHDPAVLARLVEANLRLVVAIARQHCRDPRLFADVIQEGNVGLLRGLRKFDPARGARLSTFTTYWIRAYVINAILKNWRLVKTGTTETQRRVFFRLRRELARLGPDASVERLAACFGMPEDELAPLLQHLREPELSFDAPASAASESSLGEVTAGSPELRPDVRVEQAELRSLVRRKLSAFEKRLSARDRTVVRELWLRDPRPTLERLGRRFGISRERVRQIELRCRTRFRKFLVAGGAP